MKYENLLQGFCGHDAIQWYKGWLPQVGNELGLAE